MTREMEIAARLQIIGEPVCVFYDERNDDDDEWLVGLERVPMIHGHFESLLGGLMWLVDNKQRFTEWEEQIKEAENARPWKEVGDGEEAAVEAPPQGEKMEKGA